jgi:hypothetical protein
MEGTRPTKLTNEWSCGQVQHVAVFLQISIGQTGIETDLEQ